jgi:hypothetical protein
MQVSLLFYQIIKTGQQKVLLGNDEARFGQNPIYIESFIIVNDAHFRFRIIIVIALVQKSGRIA